MADEIDDLIAKLADPEHAVRAAATEKLIALNPDPGRIARMAEASMDPETRQRLSIVLGMAGGGWKKLTPEEISKLASQGRENGKKIYLAKTVINGTTYIGKHMPEWGASNFPIGDKEVLIRDFLVWTGKGSWKEWKPGLKHAIPMGAGEDHKIVYAARASYNNGIHPGMWVQGEKTARIPWGDKVHHLEKFEVLVADVED